MAFNARLLIGEVPALAGLLPLVLFLLAGCTRTLPPHGEAHKLENYGLQVETPPGWTGGVAGGTHEFRSPDGNGRVRIAPLEGPASPQELKEGQLMSGTGATVVTRVLPPSTTKIGALNGVRARFLASDGRLYDLVALALPGASNGGHKMVVLFQTSVTADYASQEPAAVEALFTSLRQSIQTISPVATAGGR